MSFVFIFLWLIDSLLYITLILAVYLGIRVLKPYVFDGKSEECKRNVAARNNQTSQFQSLIYLLKRRIFKLICTSNFRPYFILMLTSSSSYSNNIKVMMAIDITVTKYNLIHLN